MKSLSGQTTITAEKMDKQTREPNNYNNCKSHKL